MEYRGLECLIREHKFHYPKKNYFLEAFAEPYTEMI